MEEEPLAQRWEAWEGAYPVPDLHLEACPWCLQPQAKYFVLVFQAAGQLLSEPVCERCSAVATHYIEMRKAGLSRKMALNDFGWRERGGKKP